MLIGEHLLYKILKEKRADALQKVKKKWLVEEELRFLRAIKKYLKKYGVLPPPPKDPPADFEDHPIEYYLDTLYERHLQQVLLDVADDLRGAENPHQGLSRALRVLMSEALDKMTHEHVVISEDDLLSDVKQVIDDARVSSLKGLVGIETGWPLLDTITGGYSRGDVWAFTGRPKSGKSQYLVWSFNHVVRNHRTMFVSMELAKEEIYARLWGIVLKTSPTIFYQGRISSFVEKKIEEEMEKIKKNFLFVESSAIKAVTDLYPLIEAFSPELIFIDAAYLIPGPRWLRTDWEKARYIIEEIKRVAMRARLPIICSYQLNREAARAKNLDTAHVALSDAIGQIVSFLVAITKEQNGPEEQRKMQIVASRKSVADVAVPLKWNWLKGEFGEDDSAGIGTEAL